MQLRFASFAVINSREDLHLQECAHAGRTKGNPAIEKVAGFFFSASQAQWSPDFGAMGRKKPRPVMGGVGAPPAPPNGQTPGAKRCLLGGFGSSS
ncbi:MAG: hypothetical protein ACRC4O_05085, partial [Giesbergeria sp.]